MTEKQINNVIDNLRKLGFDTLRRNNHFVTIKNGLINEIPFKSINNFLNPIEEEINGVKFSAPPMSIEDAVSMITTVHNTKVDMRDGKYDNIEPMTSEESLKKLTELLKPWNYQKKN